jgi:hypothetical protein
LNVCSDIKEHVAITIFASTAADSALAISIFAADDLYYNIQVSHCSGWKEHEVIHSHSQTLESAFLPLLVILQVITLLYLIIMTFSI